MQDKPILLFTTLLIAIGVVYINILGEYKTIGLILDQYILIAIIIIAWFISLYFSFKLRAQPKLKFVQNNQSFKSMITIFLIFQVVDYYFEDGFIGMISQWFLYWLFGVLSLIVMKILNQYKTLKFIQLQKIS